VTVGKKLEVEPEVENLPYSLLLYAPLLLDIFVTSGLSTVLLHQSIKHRLDEDIVFYHVIQKSLVFPPALL
jgi:hypothetical protein